MDRSALMQQVADGYVQNEKFANLQWQVQVGDAVLTSGRSGDVAVDALYRIYSMTKPIVSLMALILVEQGKLRLYDPVAIYDPAFAKVRVLQPNGQVEPLNRPILVEDLLTHRAGFTYEFIHGCHVAPYYRDAQIAGDGQRSLEAMMAALAEMPVAFQPGTAYRYSVSIDVVAHVVERAAGRGIDELLDEYIFAPLGMSDTAYHVPAAKRSRLLPMYGSGEITAIPQLDLKPHVLKAMDVDDMYPCDRPETFRRGGHGLFSTLADYAAFARMLLDGRGPDGRPVISRKMLAMLQANRLPESQLPLRVGMNALPGYGWGLIGRVMTDPGRALSLTGDGEFGWAGAASTYFWVDPAESMTGVVMSQYLGSMLPMTDDMRTAAYQMLV